MNKHGDYALFRIHLPHNILESSDPSQSSLTKLTGDETYIDLAIYMII